MLQRLKRVGTTLILVASPLVTLALPDIAHAAGTDTWTGGGSDNKFSTAANWDNGVPTADTNLVFNNATGSPLTVDDDLVGVNLGTITFTGAHEVMVLADNPVTLDGDVTSSTAGSNGGVDESSIDGELTLGANITVTNVDLDKNTGVLASGDGKTLHLNGKTLNFVNNDAGGTGVASISDDITGSGTLTINIGQASMYFDGTNNYSGTTNIVSSGNITTLSNTNTAGLLGTSSIIVSGSATLSLNAVSDYTFTNPITFQQASQNNNVYGQQFIVWNHSPSNQQVTVTVPGITLAGNTRFGVNEAAAAVKVNLAGITAAGHCVQYGDENNIDAGKFLNGPTACVVAGASTTTASDGGTAPKTPDTGFAAITAHPVVTIVSAIAATGALVFLARRATVFTQSRKLHDS